MVFAIYGEDVVFEEVVWRGDGCTGKEVQLPGKAVLALSARPLPGPESRVIHSLRGRTLYSCPHSNSTVHSIELLWSGGWQNKSRHMREPEGPSSLGDIRDHHVREHLESHSDSYFVGKLSREIVYEEKLTCPTVQENQGHGS